MTSRMWGSIKINENTEIQYNTQEVGWGETNKIKYYNASFFLKGRKKISMM